MLGFNLFVPNKPYPATLDNLYDIENQYEEWEKDSEDTEEDKNDFVVLKIKNLFGRV
jgi:hypothetical protein